jgi:hypothetical protein
MRELWWTKWHWCRFFPSPSVSPANSHSTDCSTFIIMSSGAGTIGELMADVPSGLSHPTPRNYVLLNIWDQVISKGDNRKLCNINCDKSMHRPETKIEREVKILCNKLSYKPSPWKPVHRIKWRICETIFLPAASAICGVNTEQSDPVSETLCSLIFRIPDGVQKPADSECYTLSSEPFSIYFYQNSWVTFKLMN